MDPVDALERIVYLLDRDLAPGAKVRAFLRAAEVVSELDPDELRSLHQSGRLQELPGIGESTGRVIAEALDGEVPAYLTKLEEITCAHPARHNKNLSPLIHGPIVQVTAVHAKVRRDGYRKSTPPAELGPAGRRAGAPIRQGRRGRRP